MKVSYKSILWFWLGWSSIPKVPKNSKFAMPLQYLKQEVRDEVDFLHADKHQSWFQHFWHQSFLQGFLIDEHNQSFSKYSK